MTIEKAFEQVMDTVKISEPAAVHRAAADSTVLSVNLVDFSADQFKAEHPATSPATKPTTATASATTAPSATTNPITLVASRATTFPTLVESAAAPSPEEVSLYNKFKDVEPERVDYLADPFGFAYKFPNRIKFDTIFISADTVENQIVVPELAMLRYFRDHGTDYPATQPTTVPAATQASTEGAATGPATRAAANGPTTRGSRPTVFADVRTEIEKKLKEEFTRKMLEEIRKDIANQLNTDYQAYGEAQKSGKKDVSSLGVPFGSYEYLEEVAKHIENLYGSGGKYKQLYHDNFFPNDPKEEYTGKMFDIFPNVNNRADQWWSAKDLETLKPNSPGAPGIATAVMQGTYMPFPTYATEAADAFLNDTQRKVLKDQHIQPLAVWQPSQPVYDVKHIYYFRLTNADPAHTPPIAEILPRVREDARTLAAYEKGEAQANQFMAAAREIGLQQAANEPQWKMQGGHVISVGPFKKESDARDPETTFAFVAFPLPEPARTKFTDEALKLLDDYAKDPTRRAVRVIPLPSVGRVVVAELDSTKLQPLTKDASYGSEIFKAQRSIYVQRMKPIMEKWFTPANIDQRTGFKGSDIKHDERPQNNNTGPVFPF